MDCNKLTEMENKKYHTEKLLETGAKSILLTHIYMTADSPSWFGTGSSIQIGGVKLIQSNKIGLEVWYK